MPDFDASGYDAQQLQQILTTYTLPGGVWSLADEARRRSYFGKMEPRVFATVYATFRHIATSHCQHRSKSDRNFIGDVVAPVQAIGGDAVGTLQQFL